MNQCELPARTSELLRRHECDAHPSELRGLRGLVRGACRSLNYTRIECDRIALAVDEACANVIRHAYRGGPGKLEVEILAGDSCAVFRVRDFAPRAVCVDLAPRHGDPLVPGGMGLALIHEIMDTVRFQHAASGTGNVLEMSRALPPRADT